VYNNLLYLP